MNNVDKPVIPGLFGFGYCNVEDRFEVEREPGSTGWKLKAYYPDGVLKQSTSYNNASQLDGEFIYWGRDGNMRESFNFKRGFMEGVSYDWYPGSRPKCISHWSGSRKNGTCKEWHMGYTQSDHLYEYSYYIDSRKVSLITIEQIMSFLYLKHRLRKLIQYKLRTCLLDRHIISDLGNIIMLYYWKLPME